jgi:predicted transcriptional regulator
MKLKDIEIKVMSDKTYGAHLDKLFEDIKAGKITEKQKPNIVAHAPEDIAKILTNERIRLLQVIREKNQNPSASLPASWTAASPMSQMM